MLHYLALLSSSSLLTSLRAANLFAWRLATSRRCSSLVAAEDGDDADGGDGDDDDGDWGEDANGGDRTDDDAIEILHHRDCGSAPSQLYPAFVRRWT